jgi:hypothetical protein
VANEADSDDIRGVNVGDTALRGVGTGLNSRTVTRAGDGLELATSTPLPAARALPSHATFSTPSLKVRHKASTCLLNSVSVFSISATFSFTNSARYASASVRSASELLLASDDR